MISAGLSAPEARIPLIMALAILPQPIKPIFFIKLHPFYNFHIKNIYSIIT
jgi:hypothetical protein